MKKTNKNLSIISLMLLLCFCAFAAGSFETSARIKVEESAIDESVELNAIVQEYIDELEDHYEQYERYSVSMQMAYNKSDVDAYLEAKNSLRGLSKPVLTEEETNLALTQILEQNDTASAKALYQYSKYYHPVLTLQADNNGFTYKSTLTLTPGSEITLPELKPFDRTMVFKGWGTEDGVVAYEAGETVQMPLEDATLYAVFESDSSLIDGPSVEFTVEDEELELERNKQTEFSFTLKNNGTENLSDVEVLLESDDPLLVVLNEKLTSRYIETCAERNAKYMVITKAASGTELNAVITVKDSDNNVWTKNVTFTVK